MSPEINTIPSMRDTCEEERFYRRGGGRGEVTDISQVSWSPPSVTEHCAGPDIARAAPARTKEAVSRCSPWALGSHTPLGGDAKSPATGPCCLRLLASTSFHYPILMKSSSTYLGHGEHDLVEDSEAQRRLYYP